MNTTSPPNVLYLEIMQAQGVDYTSVLSKIAEVNKKLTKTEHRRLYNYGPEIENNYEIIERELANDKLLGWHHYFREFADNSLAQFRHDSLRMSQENPEFGKRSDVELMYKNFLERDIFIGEFPTHDANACAINTNNGCLVLINTGIMQLIHKTSKCALSLISIRSFDKQGKFTGVIDQDDSLLSIDKSIKNLSDALVSYRQCGLLSSDPIKLTPGLQFFHSSILIAAEAFIIFHELAHILLGHIEKTSEQKKITVSNAVNMNVPIKNYNQEIMADILAVNVLLRSMPPDVDEQTFNFTLQMMVAGTGLLFKLFGLLESLYNVDHSTHPPAEIRWRAVSEVFTSVFPPDVFNFLEYYDYTLSKIEDHLIA